LPAKVRKTQRMHDQWYGQEAKLSTDHIHFAHKLCKNIA